MTGTSAECSTCSHAAGELQNTLVIVTSDNGMPFPRAKANLYEYGIHMPLAVSWPARIPAGRTIDDLVSLIDLTAAIYEASGVEPPEREPIAGRRILKLLSSDREGIVEPWRDAVFAGRERHSSSRFNSLGYPQRAIRTHRHLLIRNFRPERWPAGAPQKFGTSIDASNESVVDEVPGPMHGGYHDIDACPTLDVLIQHATDPVISRYLHLAVDKRPEIELFDISIDPGCLKNLAEDPALATTRQRLADRLADHLKRTGDTRVVGASGGDNWETYPRYSPLRWFPTPAWACGTPIRSQSKTGSNGAGPALIPH